VPSLFTPQVCNSPAPNFIKLAPVSKELKKGCEEVIVHTGQHYDYDMDRIFFDELKIPEPDYHLGVGSGPHGSQTGEMLKRIEEVLVKEAPDVTLVIGDTNTTLAGALASAKLHTPVAHVESGLRSYDRAMPEEINRVLTDHVSRLLFCPTSCAVENLEKEGITQGVMLTGDVTVDVMGEHLEVAARNSRALDELGLTPGDYYLATIHRAENTDRYENLASLVDVLCEIGNVVFPCHPRTEKYLRSYGLWDRLAEHVKITRPLGYYDILTLEKNARMVLTDSGGIQKEAYILKVPCITLRNTTEWRETLQSGWNVLTGSDKAAIVRLVGEFRPDPERYGSVFGDGRASARIREALFTLNSDR
jgi:UDP-N-acetylglucosamine 2-epimerase (non-hydrolysing)